jgi:hypothetical protein
MQPGREEGFSLSAVPIGGDHNRQRLHQVGRDAQECSALPTRFPQTKKISVLKVAYPAVHHFKMVGRSGSGKVPAVDKRNRETSQRRIPSGTGTVSATTDDYQIVVLLTQRCNVPSQPLLPPLSLSLESLEPLHDDAPALRRTASRTIVRNLCI